MAISLPRTVFHKGITCLLFICMSLSMASASDEVDYFIYGDFTYRSNIQTVLFSQKGFDLSDPLIRMQSNDQLLLRFDDLDADYKDYHYTIIHCDAYWQPSELREFEYIQGFYTDQIRTYNVSRNTRVSYTHYQLEFPNNNMQPSKSGNYILKVFLYGNPDEVVLTRRFMVLEEGVSVAGQAIQANLVRYRDRKQQVIFTVQAGNMHIANPYRDLRVVITQNGRWDNAITGLEPRFVQGNRLTYDYEEETLFQGGNEFRRFDIRSLRHLSERVADVRSSRRYWDVYLLPDRIRLGEPYVNDNDMNGRFQVMTSDAPNDMVESDYAWVHFYLPMRNPLEHGHLYVLGGLTDWQFTDQNRMNYNYGENAYELSLLLKQGVYNYQYAFLQENEGGADVSMIEGSHSQTENTYNIFVYYRRPGDLYDRLVGVSRVHTIIR